MSKADEANFFKFFSFGLGKYIESVILRVRSQIYEYFTRAFAPFDALKVVDVGVSDEDSPTSNLFEKRFPFSENLTAVSPFDHKNLEEVYPGLNFVQADGRDLPFKDDEFDLSHSHAVIEHVGDSASQIQFIQELIRVSKKGVCFTTPNRWHPMEFHTGLPLFHWLPQSVCFVFYRLLGKSFYADSDNLNLLSARQLKSMLKSMKIQKFQNITFEYTRWLGFRANIVVLIS